MRLGLGLGLDINKAQKKRGVNINVPLLTYRYNAHVPEITANVNIDAPLLTYSNDTHVPVVGVGVNLEAPLLNQNYDAHIPVVGVGVNAEVPLLTQPYTLHVPEVSTGTAFTFSVETTNTSAGSSNNDQFKVPTISTGSYNCNVNWGDGNDDDITTWNDAAWTHTYASSGEYEIVITGTFEGWRFNNTGDKLKLLDISAWGEMKLGTNEGNYFHGATNMVISATDELDTSSMTSLYQAFFNCQSLTGALNFSDTSNVTTFRQMLYSCFVFNDSSASNFDMSSATTLYGMYYGASAFDQDISSYDISNVSTMEWMLGNCGISDSNYSDALIAWNAGSHQNNVTLTSAAKYEAGAAAARTDFINNHGWTINDGGPA